MDNARKNYQDIGFILFFQYFRIEILYAYLPLPVGMNNLLHYVSRRDFRLCGKENIPLQFFV